MSGSPFASRTLPWIIGVSVASFIGGIVLAILGPDLAPVSTVLASGYSRSALGHQAFVELLEELGVPVVVSRHDSAHKVGQGGVLIVAEPRVDDGAPIDVGDEPTARLARMLTRAPATLLVLPKWEGRPDPRAPAWIREAVLVESEAVQAVLDAAGIEATVHRVTTIEVATESLQGTHAPPLLFAPTVQLLRGDGLTALVEGPEGVLLATVPAYDPPLLLLADPDPISNAGLHRGANAVFATRLVERLRSQGGVVVLDETLHGHESQASIWRELFSFPLVLVPLHLLLLLGILLWATMGRFGAPQKPAPALEPGTTFLVTSTADLLRHGTSAPRVLKRYLDVVRREVAAALNAPQDLKDEALDAWLDRVAARRDVALRTEDLRAAVVHAQDKPPRVRAAAREIHQWREEILHGSVRRTHAA